MTKYHVNNAYEVKLCKATLIPCRFKQHYADETEAYKNAEILILEENQHLETLSSLNSLTSKPRIKGILNKENFKNLDPITQKTVIAGVNRINTSLSLKEQEYWQSIYDQSPTGNIALQRLKTINSSEYEKKKKLAEIYSFNDASTSYSHIEQALNNHPQSDMLLLSATWMSNMSPEETDSVYWTTTHGAGILNKHIRGQVHPSAHNYSTDFLDKQAKLFSVAMHKAPISKKPITLYRGTRLRNVIENELNSPASSSTDFAIADKFAKQKPNNVIMEISTTKIPCAVTMSSWGNQESEVLAPLGKYIKIGEKTMNNNSIVQLKFVE